MHKTSLLLTFIILITAAAAHADGVRLTFEHPIQLAIPGVDALGKAETIDAGKEIVIDAENTYWISAKGKVPLLVVPINVKAKNTITNFHMPDVATWPSQLVEREQEQLDRSHHPERARHLHDVLRISVGGIIWKCARAISRTPPWQRRRRR